MIAAAALFVALQISAAPPSQDERLQQALARVSEEAETFRQLAPKVVGVETLLHHGRKAPPRFRLRIGQSALEAPQATYLTREIVSEYGYSTFKDAPEALREFRQVVSVDSAPVKSHEEARLALALNMTSDDDRRRKRMLEEFESYGTVGAATDFGQMLLLFRRRQLDHYTFSVEDARYIGAESCLVIRYVQLNSPDTARVYTGKQLIRVPMEGQLWVRSSDNVPIRITMHMALDEQGHPVEHNATIDYSLSPLGLMLPASIHYTRETEGIVLVDNTYTYSDFKMFRADSEIKFTFEPVPQP